MKVFQCFYWNMRGNFLPYWGNINPNVPLMWSSTYFHHLDIYFSMANLLMLNFFGATIYTFFLSAWWRWSVVGYKVTHYCMSRSLIGESWRETAKFGKTFSTPIVVCVFGTLVSKRREMSLNSVLLFSIGFLNGQPITKYAVFYFSIRCDGCLPSGLMRIVL